jgi:predicted dinucleotide-binding enzyme
LDTTNICYKLEDETSFIGKSSSTEKNIEAVPGARWVAGFKNVGRLELYKKDPASKAEIFSDDKEALNKVVALVNTTGFPIQTVGPLVGGREAEVRLWEHIKRIVSVVYSFSDYV